MPHIHPPNISLHSNSPIRRPIDIVHTLRLHEETIQTTAKNQRHHTCHLDHYLQPLHPQFPTSIADCLLRDLEHLDLDDAVSDTSNPAVSSQTYSPRRI